MKMSYRTLTISLLVMCLTISATSFGIYREFPLFKETIVSLFNFNTNRNLVQVVTSKQLGIIAPNGKPHIINTLSKLSIITINKCDLYTRNRTAYFYSVAAKESWGFTKLVERTDTKRFKRYDKMRKRLGNIVSGDGAKYRGRGIIQLTGRRNYRVVGRKIGIDLVNKPWLAADLAISIRTACVFWTTRRIVRNRRTGKRYRVTINEFVDRNNLKMVTKLITGSRYQQLKDRKIYLNRAQIAFKDWSTPPVAGWNSKFNAEDYVVDDLDEPFGQIPKEVNIRSSIKVSSNY